MLYFEKYHAYHAAEGDPAHHVLSLKTLKVEPVVEKLKTYA